MATYRNCAGVWGERSLRLGDVVRPQTTTDGGKQAAVTMVDLLLGGDVAGFVFGNGYHSRQRDWFASRYNRSWGGVGGNLNAGGNWDTVINELKETCVSAMPVHSRYDKRQKVTVYTVPAIGFIEQPIFVNQWKLDMQQQQHLPHPSDVADEDDGGKLSKKSAIVRKVLRDPYRYFYWRGEFLDTAYFYNATVPSSFVGASKKVATKLTQLSVVGLRTPEPPILPPEVKPFLKKVRGHNAAGRRVDLRHRWWASVYGKERNEWSDCAAYTAAVSEGGCTDDYLEIDLQFPRLVTHIATAGAEPMLDSFPDFDYAKHMNDRRCVAGVHLNKCAMTVKVNAGGQLGWVSSYELQVLDPLISKWRTVVVATANSDALSVAVLDLRPHFTRPGGLFARRLRIRPLTFVHSPTLRAVVYGSSSSSEEEEEGGGAPPITVEYTVAETRANADCRFVRDGLSVDYGYHQERRNQGRNAMSKDWKRHYHDQHIKYDWDASDPCNDDSEWAAAYAPQDDEAAAQNQSRLIKAYQSRTISWDFQS